MSEKDDQGASQLSDILSKAGYRPEDPESFKRGAAAFMAAQMVALAAGLAKGPPGSEAGSKAKPGRNDPCPCGSGKKYKKCCLSGGEGPKDAKDAKGADGVAGVAGALGVAEADSSAARAKKSIRTKGRALDAGDSAAAAPSPSFGGVQPAFVPRITLPELQADTVRLAELFVRDPSLERCRFPVDEVIEHLGKAEPNAPSDERARDQWLAEQAHAFVQARTKAANEQAGDGAARAPGLSAQEILGAVKDALLEAAPRHREDPDALRALGLGLLFHSSWSPSSEQPHPLETLLFRLALHERAGAGAHGHGPSGHLSAERREAMLETARKLHDRVVDAIVADRFPVPLPLVSVLPLVIETVQLIRKTGAEEAKEAARELAIRRATEGLSAPDRELYAELCDEWLQSNEGAGDGDGDDKGDGDGDDKGDDDGDDKGDDDGDAPSAIAMVRYSRHLASAGGTSLEAVLLLAFLDHHRVTPIPGEPSPDPEGGVEIDSPEFLERYGAFLAQRGLLKLALRTFKLCRYSGEIPRSVQDRIKALEAALGSMS
jgi:hypothetical protein